MSRTREDWIKQRQIILTIRDQLHQAIDSLDYYEEWGANHDDEQIRDLIYKLQEATIVTNTLIGMNTNHKILEQET